MLVALFLIVVVVVRCTESFEPLRFLRQVTFFNKLPIPFVNRGRSSSSVNADAVLSKGATLWSSSQRNGLEWGSFDDVVMGGSRRAALIRVTNRKRW